MKRMAKLQDIVEIQRRGLARFLFEAEGDEEEKKSEEETPAEEPEAEGESEENPLPTLEPSDEEETSEEEEGETEEEKPAEPVKKNNIEAAINDLFAKAEEKALKSAAETKQAEKSNSIGESRRLRSLRPLYEEVGQLTPQIDVRVFAGEVARLVRNYRFLLDMERLIVAQAKDYLTSKYDEDHADELEEILNDEYDIDVKRTPGKPPGKLNVPNAVGARQSGT